MSGARTPRPHPLIVPLVRRVVLPLLSRRARLSAEGLHSVAEMAPPFIVLANHAGIRDPFWVAAFIRRPVQWVASDNLFRSFWLGWAMRLLGAIPKTKLMNDSETVRQVYGVLKAGGVVGIFPEGSRTDDGRTADLIPAVARLIRRLRVPVLGARIMGGYLSRPRWARYSRRGAVRIAFDRLVSADDLHGRTEEEILAVVRRHLSWDDMARQRTRMVRFRSRRPAEYLERLLFICPHCRSVSRLVSIDDRLRCTACEYAVRMNEYGFFEPCTSPLYFDSPADWNAWQLPALDRMLTAGPAFAEFVFEERSSRLLAGWRTRPLRPIERGTARLTRERILFQGESGLAWSFALQGVQGMNVQNREKLEFYHERVLYRLDFLDPRASPYKWQKAVESLARSFDQVRSLMRVNTY
jgi:1-acyl-sn-glycerol-3-phosphate acyltransferase